MLQFPETESIPDAGGRGPVELIGGREDLGLIILCDHASNHVPAGYDGLGVPAHVLASHVGYDIGARGVAVGLAELTGAPAVLTHYSRLLIDPNRGEDDPTLVMRIADGSVIEGNVGVDDAEARRRIGAYHGPYHDAIDAAIARALAAGRPPAILSVHSFTPRFKMIDRPWHITVLWDSDPRLPRALIAALRAEADIVVGENVPYSGKLRGDTLYRHATSRGLAHALVEIRQDLIATPDGQRQWAERLDRLLAPIMEMAELGEIRFFGSKTTG
jgi:predicted N-formylglutamate amidohydrolase